MPARAPRFLLSLLLLLPLPAAMAASQAQAANKDGARSAADNGLLTATIAGEYALQAGRLDEASDWYLKAAHASQDDAGLAERATRIALLANEDARAADALALWKRRAPDSLAMRGAEATLALRRGDARRARRELRALLSDTDPGAWRHALNALSSGGKDPKLAARLLGELVDDDAIPRQLPAWLAFGGLALRFGQQPLAERMVDEVVERFPNEPRVALLRASQLREAGRNDEARKALAQVASAGQLAPELRTAIAAEYDALGDTLAAAQTLALGPQTDQSYGLRASLLAKAKDDPALGRLYDELKASSAEPDPSRRLLLGQIAEYLKRYEEALDWYRSVPGGDARWLARLRATSVLHELGRKQDAYAELHEIQADAAADDATRRDAYLLEAELHAKEDPRSPAELDAYARGLAAFPDDGGLLYSRALSWERRDDIARAEADLRKILVAEPENVAALNALGYTLADRTTRYEEALRLIDRARVAEPDNAAIIDSYGWVLYRLGRNEEALAELRRAYGLQKDPEIAAHIAEVLWVTGQRDEARRYFDEARKLDPENRSLKRALEKTGA
ncbi:MAG TPA: tetratricopeptide repeat protein [Xanthomonadaceae bacterium]|nr:tetratricopeptide repeat protein [Xanthomonadaceae bacterium]